MSNDESKTLEAQLGDDDWAIIIGKDGNLKGLFIPEGKDEDEVPESIVHIMMDYYGIEFDEEIEETSDGHTLH